MSFEPDFVALLQLRCPRVYPVTAPVNTQRPYITWQHIGGQPLRYAENTAADKRHTMVQVNVWHSTLTGAFALMRQIEDDLCASTAMQAWPDAEPINASEPDFDTWGCYQDFSVVATR